MCVLVLVCKVVTYIYSVIAKSNLMQCRQLEAIVDMIVTMVITVCTEVMSLTSTSCEYIKLGVHEGWD